MKRQTTRRTLLAAAAFGAGLPLLASGVHAQETECDATVTATAPPVMFLGSGRPSGAPGALLTIYRFELAPGEVVPPHRHPGATNLHIEVGSMTYRLYEGEATILRGGTTTEPLEASGETLLETGDGIFYDADAVHEATNPGATSNRVLAVTLMDESQPATIPVDVT